MLFLWSLQTEVHEIHSEKLLLSVSTKIMLVIPIGLLPFHNTLYFVVVSPGIGCFTPSLGLGIIIIVDPGPQFPTPVVL